jgi:hypothetical protein
MPCCGKKRAAERLSRGEARSSAAPSPVTSAPLAAVRPAIPKQSRPALLATPKFPVAISPPPVARAQAASRPPAIIQTSDSEPPGDVEFEYTGTGRLTVTGPVTGATYYFSAISPSVSVHGADAPSLIPIPGLKIVS